jgi:hypothetical protein
MKTEGIAICRLVAGQRLMEGALTGFACEVCRRELQITMHTAGRVDRGELKALCGECGMAMADRLTRSGAELKPLATPAAFSQMDSLLADPRLRGWCKTLSAFHCAHCGLDVSTDQAATHQCPRQA